MQQVAQRLRVHPAVLDRREQSVRRQLIQHFVNRVARALDIAQHRVQVGPVGRTVLRALSRQRIDAGLEQPVERRMKRRHVEHATRELVPVEGIEVPDVEDQSMPFSDRPLVQRSRRDQAEQRIGVCPRGLQIDTEAMSSASNFKRIHRRTLPSDRSEANRSELCKIAGMRLAVGGARVRSVRSMTSP